MRCTQRSLSELLLNHCVGSLICKRYARIDKCRVRSDRDLEIWEFLGFGNRYACRNLDSRGFQDILNKY